MSTQLRQRLYDELDQLVLIDPHTHIDPHRPAAANLAEILGYHYYTELVHSAGVPREEIEDPQLSPRDKTRLLIEHLGRLDNTVQYSWFLELMRYFGFTGERIDAADADPLYDLTLNKMARDDWPQQVLRDSKLEAVFLTNDFDDPLVGFDTKVFVPCLRTDDLVFHLGQPTVRERLQAATDMDLIDAASLRRAIGKLFQRFRSSGARACAISLPPTFEPEPPSTAQADSAWRALLRTSEPTGSAAESAAVVAQFVFWTLAEHCADHHMPFDLMIGVNRSVYPGGVHQGRDLYDSRVSLHQYRKLLSAFPSVTFPISVLASVTNQELASYAWIFPNVVTHGHWWYSNTPTFIEHDLSARIEAVPRNKQIGYYSDMYKLEFALPKFAMYKRILAKVLAERFVIDRQWSERRAIELGRELLRGNVERVFYA